MNLFRGSCLVAFLTIPVLSPHACRAQFGVPNAQSNPTAHDPLLIINSFDGDGILGVPNVLSEPDIKCIIVVEKNAFNELPANVAKRAQEAKDMAYDNYIAMCVMRSLMSLPIPTIEDEKAEQEEEEYPYPFQNKLRFSHSLWLDDPLDLVPTF